MTGPDWPRRRYELLVKKGTTPLGLKLHQTKTRKGVYTNGFADGPYPPPGPQACMRVGDILVSVDGKDVLSVTLPVALGSIEHARRRDRLRDFISSKQDDARRGSIALIFERVMPKLTFRDVVLDPRKVAYLLNYMLEVRRATSTLNQVSLDEARLMFWLEAHVLFEMAALMTPSRADMAKIFDKFFREGSGFYLNDGIDQKQLKHVKRNSLDGQRPARTATSSSEESGGTDTGAHQRDGFLPGEPAHFPDPAGALPQLARKGNSSMPLSSEGGDMVRLSPGFVVGGECLAMEFQAADLSRMFKDAMEKVEETLTGGCFFRYTTSPWFGRMVAHLSNSPDFVRVPFERIMAEPELRDVMILHMIVGQSPGWLQVWREVELAVKPRMVVLQTRRSVRATRRKSVGGGRGGGGVHARVNSAGSIPSRSRRSTFPGNGDGPNFNSNGSTKGNSSGSDVVSHPVAETKADAAVAILASAAYLWDFFLSNEAHASLGLSQESHAYVTLRELLEEGGVGRGGVGVLGSAAVADAVSPDGGDAGVDVAVTVGKALLDMQRQVLRKLCASVYPDFQASSTYEHLCDELATGMRSPARAIRPPALPPPSASMDQHSSNPTSNASTHGNIAVVKIDSDTISPLDVAPSTSLNDISAPGDGDRAVEPGSVGSQAGASAGPFETIAFSPPRQLGLNGRPEIPFVFLGNSPEKRRNSQDNHDRSVGHSRSSTSPALGAGHGEGGGDGGGVRPVVGRTSADGRANSPIDVGSSMTGPDFRTLWEASRGCVLEKIMRRIELPSHISRHRPPWGGGPTGGGGGGRGGGQVTPVVRRLSRSGSGATSWPASPELREHLSLPPASRRFGRRPYPIAPNTSSCSTRAPDAATAPLATSSKSLKTSASFHLGDISTLSSEPDGLGEGWQVTSPPGVFGTGRGLDNDKANIQLEDDKGCASSAFAGGVRSRDGSEEEEEAGGLARVSEWVVAFSSCLEDGITNVKVGGAVHVGARSRGKVEAAPEGLEPFFCPDLPASGRGPCYCLPEGGFEDDGDVCGRPRRSLRRGCPSPRLFTFAAPGRSGAGVFYGVCLSVFRPVVQWGGENTGPTQAGKESDGLPESSPSSTTTTPTTTAFSGTATNGFLSQVPETSPLPSGVESGGGGGALPTSNDEESIPTPLPSFAVATTAEITAASTQTPPPPPTASFPEVMAAASTTTDSGASQDGVTSALQSQEAQTTEGLDSVPPTAVDVAGINVEAGDVVAAAGASAGLAAEAPAEEGAKTAPAEGAKLETRQPTTAHHDVPSRFKMTIGMFGGSSRSSNASKAASSAAAAAAAASGSGSGKGSVSSSSSGPSKFSSYAGRARSFLGSSESRGIGRSPKATTAAAAAAAAAGAAVAGSADTEAYGPPPPEPRVPVFLSSPPVPKTSMSFDIVDTAPPGGNPGHEAATIPRTRSGTGGMFAAAAAAVVGSASSHVGTDGGGGGGGGGGIKSGVFGSNLKSVGVSSKQNGSGMLTSSVVDGTERGIGGDRSGGVAEASSMASGANGHGENESKDEGSAGSRKRQRHVFYVPSGICLLSTRPESGAMRRALSAYWVAHGERLLEKEAAVTTGQVDDSTPGATESLCNVDEPTTAATAGRCKRARINVCGENDDEGEQDDATAPESTNEYGIMASDSYRGPWADLSALELEQLLEPFLTIPEAGGERRSSADHDEREQAAAEAGESETVTSPEGTESRTGTDSAASAGRSEWMDTAASTGCPPVRKRSQTPPFFTTHPRSSAVGCKRPDWAGLDFDPSVVLRCLSPRHLCMVITSLLCERKVVMISSRLSLLTAAGEVFRALLQPLTWTHVYVPLLPRRMAADLLQCPTPFLLGLHAETARGLDLPRDAVQVHLDTDHLAAPNDFVGLAPMSTLRVRLSSVVNPRLEDLDSPGASGEAGVAWTSATSEAIRACFREFMSELLQGSAECSFEVGQGSSLTVLLDERLYKKAKAAAAEAAEEIRCAPTSARLHRAPQVQDNSTSRGEGVGTRDRAGTTTTTASEWDNDEGGASRRDLRGEPLYNTHCDKLLDQFVKTQMLSHYLSEGVWQT